MDELKKSMDSIERDMRKANAVDIARWDRFGTTLQKNEGELEAYGKRIEHLEKIDRELGVLLEWEAKIGQEGENILAVFDTREKIKHLRDNGYDAPIGAKRRSKRKSQRLKKKSFKKSKRRSKKSKKKSKSKRR
jgi:hypothetical protein